MRQPNAEFQHQPRQKKGRCCGQKYQQLEGKKCKENKTWFNKTREITFTPRQEFLRVIMNVFIRDY